MSDDRWIVIPRWEDFQHRDSARSQIPPWIKDHTEQLSKDAYLDLSFAQRGLLCDLRREYARSRRELSANPTRLSRRLGKQVTARMLQALCDAGFLAIVAGKPARDPARTPAGVEEETEREEETEQDLEVQNQNQNPPPLIARPPTREELTDPHYLARLDFHEAMEAAEKARLAQAEMEEARA